MLMTRGPVSDEQLMPNPRRQDASSVRDAFPLCTHRIVVAIAQIRALADTVPMRIDQTRHERAAVALDDLGSLALNDGLEPAAANDSSIRNSTPPTSKHVHD